MRTLAPLAIVVGLTACASAERPRPGDVAPPFRLPATDGRTVALADYQGKKTVVLAFFPKAFTGG